MRYQAALVTCSLLWAAALPLAASEVEPTSLYLLRSGDLAILDVNQGLFLLSAKSGQVRPLGRSFTPFVAMDMAGAFLDGGDNLFVTLSLWNARGDNRTQLARFNAAGERTGDWPLPEKLARLSGVAVDPEKKIAYVANTKPAEVYKVDLSRPRTPMVRMPGIRGAERLGSMVLDARRNRLLIADPYLGRIYAYDLAKGYGEVLFEKVGEVGGLTLDPATDRLYIADIVRRRVLVANLSERSSPAPLAAKIPLDEPLGLALGGDGTLWIADKDDEEVLSLTSAGRIRAFSLEKVAPAAVSKKK